MKVVTLFYIDETNSIVGTETGVIRKREETDISWTGQEVTLHIFTPDCIPLGADFTVTRMYTSKGLRAVGRLKHVVDNVPCVAWYITE